jgi:hypothetical protein
MIMLDDLVVIGAREGESNFVATGKHSQPLTIR